MRGAPEPKASAQAAMCYASGDVSGAEYFARFALMDDPRDADALAVLARLSMDWRAFDFAQDYAARALATNPYLKPAKKVVEELAKVPAEARGFRGPAGGEASTWKSAADPAARVLLIKSWGAGFWSDVLHVLGQLVLASVSGRTPIIAWGERSRFLPADWPGNGSEAWSQFFEPVSELRLHDVLARGDLSCYPPCWNRENLQRERGVDRAANLAGPWDLYTLNRPERVVVSNIFIGMWDIANWIPAWHPWHGLEATELVRRAFQHWARPVKPVVDAVERFAAEHFSSRPLIALHLRGTDKVGEVPDLALANVELVRHVSELLGASPGARVFLLTDTVQALADARQRWGERVIATDCFRSSNQESIHFQQRSDPNDGVKFGREVLVDALLASRCDSLVGIARSNVAAMIGLMKAWEAGALRLLGPPMIAPQRIEGLPRPVKKR
ncbi:MAG: hypothetical protein SFZ23_03990 [Planctomycetota bacterium]|nr:hypothetical protein [Planctomycetota bacterium]